MLDYPAVIRLARDTGEQLAPGVLALAVAHGPAHDLAPALLAHGGGHQHRLADDLMALAHLFVAVVDEQVELLALVLAARFEQRDLLLRLGQAQLTVAVESSKPAISCSTAVASRVETPLTNISCKVSRSAFSVRW